ncbi:hypothetical protein [Sphingobium olei]|uniref:Uncharacterized protein n=1 Tax=Sphingobium olei TaxID=420955 RepID=A0ABW3P732_9SPHN
MTKKKILFFVSAIIGIVLVYAVAFSILKKAAPDWPTRGQIGDSLNIITSLFSILGFLILLSTLRLQLREMNRMKRISELETGKILIQHYEQKREVLEQERERAEGPRRANLTVGIRENSKKIERLYEIMDKNYDAIGDF